MYHNASNAYRDTELSTKIFAYQKMFLIQFVQALLQITGISSCYCVINLAYMSHLVHVENVLSHFKLWTQVWSTSWYFAC